MARFQLAEAMEILSRTGATLRAMLGELSEPWLECDEGPDTWSPRDIIAHLIQGEQEDWIPRARVILEQGEARAFYPFDRFAFREWVGDWTTAELLDEFDKLRKQNLEALTGFGLSDAQLALKGTHPAFGPVTLGQLIATWTVHDLSHIHQISRVLAKRYDGDVGPWKEYLGVLQG